MLSQRIYTGIDIFMSFASNSVGALPFTWCPNQKLFIKSKSARKRYIIYVSTVLLWNIYLLFQIYHFNKQKNHNGLNLLVAFSTASLIALEACMLPLLYEDSLLLEVNSIIAYLQRVQDIYIRLPNKAIKFVEILLLLQLSSLMITCVVECLFFLLYPESPITPGYLIPSSWPFFIRISFTYFLPCYASFVGYMVLYFHFFIGIIYGALLMPFCLKELCLNQRIYKSVYYLRTDMIFQVEYRAVYILQQRFNNFTGKLLIPTQFLSGGVFVFASFVVIKHRNDLEGPFTLMMVLWSIISAGMWGLALNIGGYVFSNGIKLLNTWKYCKAQKWKRRRERLLMMKFLKSSRPLVISFGNVYTIRKLTVLAYFKGLATCLTRTLLTLQTNT